MTQDEALRISRVGKTERVSFTSRLAGLRCPVCGAILQLYPMLGTNPLYGEKWADAHACANCETLLRLTGKHRALRFLLLHVPVFLLTVALLTNVVTQFDFLSKFNVGRGHVEPNILGLALIMVVFVAPIQTALLRFEKVEVLR
ncbi:MAG: hypothetical protein AAF511_13060 [Pseudomonadota bacterium]